MKKQYRRMFASAAVLGMLLTGCGGPAASAQPAASAAPAASMAPADPDGNLQARSPAGRSASQAEEAARWGDHLLEEALSQEGTLEAGGREIAYSYHVPRLRADSPAAQALNRQILEEAGALCEENLSSIRQGKPPACECIQWQSFWYGSLLSILVQVDSGTAPARYLVYRYDFDSQVSYSALDFWEALGQDREYYVPNLRRSAALEFDKAIPAYQYLGQDALTELRASTLANSNMFRAEPFMNEQGLMAVVNFYGPDGAGVYQRILPAWTEPEENWLSADFGGAQAALIDNQLTILDRDDADSAFRAGEDAEHPVQGLYGNYVAMTAGCPSRQDFSEDVFVVLVDTVGCVSWVNLSQGGPAGGRYVACGPFWLGEKAVDCRAGEQEGLYALTEDGREMDLLPLIRSMRSYRPGSVENSTWGESSVCRLTCTPAGRFGHCRWEIDGDTYEGEFAYLGITGQGVVYSFRMQDRAGRMCQGYLQQEYCPDPPRKAGHTMIVVDSMLADDPEIVCGSLLQRVP